jgi:hypothetical protein
VSKDGVFAKGYLPAADLIAFDQTPGRQGDKGDTFASMVQAALLLRQLGLQAVVYWYKTLWF